VPESNGKMAGNHLSGSFEVQYEDQVPNVSPKHFSFPSSQFIGHA